MSGLGGGADRPPWSGPRLPLAEAIARAGGRVAGRYQRGGTRDLLEDASAIVELPDGPAHPQRPGHGDQVAGQLAPQGEAWTLREVEVLSPALREPTPGLRRLAALRPALEARARIIEAIRHLLRDAGFLEVETPARVRNPGLEPHLRPFPAGGDRYLVTSPELHLKPLLAAGYERVFELARCFRDDEEGARHASEFLMLEWYRTHAGLPDLAADVHALLPAAASAVGNPARLVEGCDLAAEPEVVTCRRAFADLAAIDDVHELSEEQFALTLAEDVEPYLGRPGPTLLTEWPLHGAALARIVPSSDDPVRPVAARMELYVGGMELANGFDELIDPREQRRRHEADRERRLGMGVEAPPLDEGFLAALEAGIPPSAGMALGVDRLVMLLLGRDDIADVRAFAREPRP